MTLYLFVFVLLLSHHLLWIACMHGSVRIMPESVFDNYSFLISTLIIIEVVWYENKTNHFNNI